MNSNSINAWRGTHVSLNLQSAEVGDDDALLYSASEAGRFRCGNAQHTHHSEAMKGKRERDDAASGGMDGCSSAGLQGGGNEGGDDDDDALHRWGG